MSTIREISRDTRISVVLPAFNESAILSDLYRIVIDILEKLNVTYEMIFINDGSTDNSGEILDEIAKKDPNVIVIHLSRNFGHQPALQAGLEYATGNAVIVMDADMQDNPETIPQFLKEWQKGYDIVYAVRVNRKENILKRFFFNAFYRLLKFISDTKIPLNAGNFGLIDRKVCKQIISFHEHDRYYPGLRSWVGFKQKGIEIDRGARYDDATRVGLIGLFKLAKAAIISFSSFPLTIFLFFGIIALIMFLGLSILTLYHKFFLGIASPGWASFLITVSFFGAINALGIGILGEYVIRIYSEVRQRPLFLVERCSNDPKERTKSKTCPENNMTK
ncbi:MAG: glycosyltransferase [Nitrospirota bacterium]